MSILSKTVNVALKKSMTTFFSDPKVPNTEPKIMQKQMMPIVFVPSLKNKLLYYNYNTVN